MKPAAAAPSGTGTEDRPARLNARAMIELA
jgi:hypothetical protein